MSHAVCLFGCPTSLAFGADVEDVSGEALVSAPPRGAAGGGCTGPVRAQFVGMSEAVCLFGGPTSFAFGTDFEDVSSDSLVSAPPKGAAGGYLMGPFGPSLWGCLRRFACLGPQTSFAFRVVSEDVSGEALVSALPRGAQRAPRSPQEALQRGVSHRPVRAQIAGMSQAVCLFACPTSCPFRALSEDASGEALVSALPRGAAGGCCTGPFAPRSRA